MKIDLNFKSRNMICAFFIFVTIVWAGTIGCTASATPAAPDISYSQEPATSEAPNDASLEEPEASPLPDIRADVVSVSTSGSPGAYRFLVTVESNDEGCHQFADWWEVISPDGELLYRRILLHSHVGEQPFTRSGGTVDIQPEDKVIVRAHMNTTGYSGISLRGSVSQGFESEGRADDLALHLEDAEPQPGGCTF